MLIVTGFLLANPDNVNPGCFFSQTVVSWMFCQNNCTLGTPLKHPYVEINFLAYFEL